MRSSTSSSGKDYMGKVCRDMCHSPAEYAFEIKSLFDDLEEHGVSDVETHVLPSGDVDFYGVPLTRRAR